MPYKSEKMKLTKEQDRRIKISERQKQEIIALKGKISQRKCAELYGISRRSVQFLWYPEKLEDNKKRREDRGGWKQYYDKEKWAETMREHRHYKQDIYLERHKMKIAHLFKETDVVFIKIDYTHEKHIKSYASSIGMKIKITTGFWVNPKTEEVEKVAKLELLEKIPNEILKFEKEKKEKKAAERKVYEQSVEERRIKRKNKKDKIVELYLAGNTMQKVADIVGCSKQYVSFVISQKRKE